MASKKGTSKKAIQSSLHQFFSSESGSSNSKSSSKDHKMTPQQHGVRIYTSEEIRGVIGFEKAYREFWNTKAEQICGSKQAVGKLVNKKAIQGSINISWILHKNELLKLEVDKVRNLASKAYPAADEIARDHALASINRNVEKMEASAITANLTYQHFLEGKDHHTSDIIQAQAAVSKEITDLKRNQDSLLKALSRKNTLFGQILSEEQKSQAATALPETTMSSDEIEEIIHDIKTEDNLTHFHPMEPGPSNPHASPTWSPKSDSGESPPPPKRLALCQELKDD